MKITFLGAAHEVTGSCTLIEVGGRYGLVDFGMEQGKDIFENQPLPVDPRIIDFVLLTHAHIDHSGNIPLLYKNGFRGTIYCTKVTYKLCSIMLRDSAHIQMSEAEWRNRKSKRSGKEEYQPIYTMEDAEGALECFRPYPYNMKVKIAEGVEIRFRDIGHLLGSACIEVWLTEGGETRKIVFSGDIGNTNQPIIRDPQAVSEADYVVVEATYGDRLHGERPDYISALAGIIQRTLDRGGNVVIPSFAVGRTQEMLYFIREIKENGLVRGHGDFPVYLDSPLAIEATTIFQETGPDYFDEEMAGLLRRGVNPLVFPGLRISITSEDSKAINFDATPKVIISASGMCEAGRIRHHLKHNLWRPECLILFVGYQAAGTLGRIIYDGAKSVKLFGETIAVKAEIALLPGVSGHADKRGILNWLAGFEKKPEMVFVNHCEDEICDLFANALEKELGYRAFAPYSGTSFDLILGSPVTITQGVTVKKAVQPKKPSAYDQLVAAGERIMSVIQSCEGMANKEILKFARQLEALADAWQR
ncbi:MAG: MBL fold metallo-hydrolase RNA specificity domain-containing protein [Oscillospiraceae bacterium]|jgi:metallo-beta-lactamase family protein